MKVDLMMKIPYELKKKLKIFAAKHDTSMTEIVIMSVEYFLREEEEKETVKENSVKLFGEGK